MGEVGEETIKKWRWIRQFSIAKCIFAVFAFSLAAATSQMNILIGYFVDGLFAWGTYLVGVSYSNLFVAINLPGQFVATGWSAWVLLKRSPQLFGCDIDACKGGKETWFYFWWIVAFYHMLVNFGILALFINRLARKPIEKGDNYLSQNQM